MEESTTDYTLDEALADPTMSGKDLVEWMYNRCTGLYNKKYHGEQLTPDEEAEIERIDEKLEEMDAPSYDDMMTGMLGALRRYDWI